MGKYTGIIQYSLLSIATKQASGLRARFTNGTICKSSQINFNLMDSLRFCSHILHDVDILCVFYINTTSI